MGTFHQDIEVAIPALRRYARALTRDATPGTRASERRSARGRADAEGGRTTARPLGSRRATDRGSCENTRARRERCGHARAPDPTAIAAAVMALARAADLWRAPHAIRTRRNVTRVDEG